MKFIQLFKGATKTKDGEMLQYSVLLCLADLDELARKAARNKSGKSQDGPLRVEITERQKPEAPVAAS